MASLANVSVDVIESEIRVGHVGGVKAQIGGTVSTARMANLSACVVDSVFHMISDPLQQHR